MSDNEKRAHDFAIAVSIDCCRSKKEAQIKAGNSEVSVDYFSEYMKIYELALDVFNQKFPNGK